jgi:uncharacterized membrane-anchored protein YhcB (DUF1043 family)
MVGRTTTTLILGIAIGALGVLLAKRFKAHRLEHDAEALIDDLARQLVEMEARIQDSAARAAANPQPA